MANRYETLGALVGAAMDGKVDIDRLVVTVDNDIVYAYLGAEEVYSSEYGPEGELIALLTHFGLNAEAP